MGIYKKIEKTIKSKTAKMIIDFNCLDSVSIETFAIKKNDNVKLTTRFLSGKILMFAKLSLMSFIYELIETFYFRSEIVKKIYQKYLIEKVYIYYRLSDTDSTCLKSIFVSSTDNDILDRKFREIIFEVIIAVEIYNRFDFND